jgi:hypothetical protein
MNDQPIEELAEKATLVKQDDKYMKIALPDYTTDIQFEIDGDTLLEPEEDSEEAQTLYDIILYKTSYKPENPQRETKPSSPTESESSGEETPTEYTHISGSESEWPIEIIRSRTVPQDIVQDLPQYIEDRLGKDGYKYYVEEMGGSLSLSEGSKERWRIFKDGTVTVEPVTED